MKGREIQKAWREKNSEYERERNRKKRQTLTPEKKKAYESSRRASLTDSYIRGLIATRTHFRYADIPDEVVELKRAAIILARLLKEIKHGADDATTG